MLLPTHPRPFLDRPIASPAPSPSLVGQRGAETVLPHSHWQDSGPHPHWGPSTAVDASREEVSLAPDVGTGRKVDGEHWGRGRNGLLFSPHCTYNLAVVETQDVQWNMTHSKLPFY